MRRRMLKSEIHRATVTGAVAAAATPDPRRDAEVAAGSWPA